MNLIELYDTLTFPDGNEKYFNAIRIPGFPNFRIGVNFEGNPVILLSVVNAVKRSIDFKLRFACTAEAILSSLNVK